MQLKFFQSFRILLMIFGRNQNVFFFYSKYFSHVVICQIDQRAEFWFNPLIRWLLSVIHYLFNDIIVAKTILHWYKFIYNIFWCLLHLFSSSFPWICKKKKTRLFFYNFLFSKNFYSILLKKYVYIEKNLKIL